VLDPQAVVLIGIEAGHQGPLEAVHDLPLLGLGDVCLLKRQHAGGIPLGVVAGVDQRLGLVRVAAQHLGTFAVPTPAQQITHRS